MRHEYWVGGIVKLDVRILRGCKRQAKDRTVNLNCSHRPHFEAQELLYDKTLAAL